MVLDASTVIAGLVLEHRGAREYLSHPALFAPQLIDLEVSQVLRKQVRIGVLGALVAQQALV